MGEDHDVKAAKTILRAGLGKITCTCVERTSTPVERALDSAVKRRDRADSESYLAIEGNWKPYPQASARMR